MTVFAQEEQQQQRPLPRTDQQQQQLQQHRVAVIGGGITGTFVAKYLTDLDDGQQQPTNCPRRIQLTLFESDEAAVGGYYVRNHSGDTTSTDSRRSVNQGATYRLDEEENTDGGATTTTTTVVELGAPIFFSERSTPLLLDMARTGNLTLLTGNEQRKEKNMIFLNAVGSVAFRYSVYTTTSNTTSGSLTNMALSVMSSMVPFHDVSSLFWRYTIDWYVISRLTSKVKEKVQEVHRILIDEDYDTNDLADSPLALWTRVGLHGMVHGGRQSLDNLCDRLMIPERLPWWRSWLLGALMGGGTAQGSIRAEFLTAATRVALGGQGPANVHALAGLWATSLLIDRLMMDEGNSSSSSSSSDDLTYRVEGGVTKLVGSAWEQAKASHHNQKCQTDDENLQNISHVPTRVATVVGSLRGFELFSRTGKSLGWFDTLVLAEPMALAKVEFLMQSHMDEEAVLQPMPLGGLIDNHDGDDEGGGAGAGDATMNPNHDGHAPLPRRLPSSVTQPYIPIVSTLVRKASLQESFLFGSNVNATTVSDQSNLQVFTTMNNEHSVSSIFQVSTLTCCSYQVLSANPLSMRTLQAFFGSSVEVEHEHTLHAPNLEPGQLLDTPFLIYDGAVGFHGQTKSGALYYPNLLELTMPTLEGSAMAAKAVANLIAKRLEWVNKNEGSFEAGEEL